MAGNDSYSCYLIDDAAKRGQLNVLMKPETIRTRCMSLLNAGRKNSLLYFKVNEKNIARCVNVISEVTKRNYPNLKIVLEHISTKDAVDFVINAPHNVGATITPHHLLLNRNNIFKNGLNPF